MIVSVESFTASDGYVWKYHRYTPDAPVRGRVVYLHGIQSHAGWYEGSCRHLARAGYTVEFLDRRGSGLNPQARGDTPSWQRLVQDISEWIGTGPKPVLLSVSWGAKLAVAVEMLHPGSTRGLGLFTPGICPRLGPPLLTRIRIGGAWLVAPWRTFPIPLDDPALFTSNPERQTFIREDPLALRRATARFFIESVRLDAAIARPKLAVPVLLLLAQKDRITANQKTREYVQRLTRGPHSIREYRGASHTLEFEPNPEMYFDDIINWLNGLP